MEFTEIQRNWTEYGVSIEQNTQVNKSILKHMLNFDFKKKANRMRLKSEWQILLSLLAATTFIIVFPFRNNASYWIGMSTYVAIVILSLIQYVTYWIKVSELSVTTSVIEMQRSIHQLEKQKLGRLRMTYIAGPFAITGMLILIEFKPFSSTLSIVFIGLILFVFIVSMIYRLRTIKNQFKRLNLHLKELSDLE